ncbi:MAG: TlpA family protein disulfide reductase [Sphingobacteriaceae bacterium]|nr:TlpA family protein disulfide reductase [Sphingobacteriaceae bacterium]
MKKHVLYLLYLACFLIISCNNSVDLPQGIWRAVLKTETGAEIPFNFEYNDSDDGKTIYLINGKDRFLVDKISTKNDSIFIQLPLFDSEIRAKIIKNGLTGKWVKHLPTRNPAMNFSAQSGKEWRFFESNDHPKYNISGRWSAVFISPDGKDTTNAVGRFDQRGNKVTGTFLTTTGDYRFLEGVVVNNKLFLSTFDGSNAYLFTGLMANDSAITNGLFHSGLTSVEKWTATKNEKAELPDAYSLTRLKEGNKTLSFSFPDLSGKEISLSDATFKNKVIVIQFLGSWCANCMDETAFLAPFYQEYKEKGVEVIGLAYERTPDFNKSKARVEQLKQRFNITYPLLITGFTNKEVLKSMPALNEFKAFPTTVLIDKEGLVRKIHTGFSGPGTGTEYNRFVKAFKIEIEQLLQEN